MHAFIGAINGQEIRRASPARDQSTLGKWRSTTGEATTCLSSSEKQSTLFPKTSSVTRYMLFGLGDNVQLPAR